MNGNRTYRHNDADGKFVRWMTEVQGDKFSSHSRPATEEEIFAGERAEARAASVAKFNAELDANANPDEVATEAAEAATKGKKAK